MFCARRRLNKYPVTCVSFPKLFGDTHLFPLENPIEIGDIIKAAFIGDLSHGGCRVDQHPGSMP
jgi:hypothetical protein